MTTIKQLNDSPLQYRQRFPDMPKFYDEIYIKNARWERLQDSFLPGGGKIWEVLYTMYRNCPKKFRYIFVDVKIQKLVVGENTANGHWHLDSSLLPDVEYHNQLFVSGYNRTEFVLTPLEIPKDIIMSAEFNNYILQQPDLEIVKIPNNQIIEYNGRNTHRGVMVTQPETRLLIRMINTDKQLPQGR